MKQQLEANISKFIWFNIFSSFVLYYSIDKVFMAARGLSTTDIVSVEITCAILVILLEVPSGAISDRWSRKYVLALNVLFFMLTTFFWVIANEISLFMVGATAAAIHMALRSGTDTSFLYDTLIQLGRTNEYEKIYGRSVFWENLFAIPAGIIGPIVAGSYGLEVPFWLTIPFSLMAFLIALSFTEPKIHRTTDEVHYWQHIVNTGKFIFNHQIVVHLIGVVIILGSTLVILDEYAQLYFAKIGLPIFFLGFLGAIGNLIEAVAGRFANKLTNVSHHKIYLAAISVSMVGFGGIWYSGNSFYGMLFVFLPWVAYYLINPLVLGDLHRILPSQQRATGESFMSLAKEIIIIPFAFLFSWSADSHSIFFAYGIIGTLVGVYLLLFLRYSLARLSSN